MPTTFDIEPPQEEDKRLFITAADESILVALAAASGLQDETVGAFAVIMVAGVPVLYEQVDGPIERDDNGDLKSDQKYKRVWNVFSEEELIEASKRSQYLLYDEPNKRLIAVTPRIPEMKIPIGG